MKKAVLLIGLVVFVSAFLGFLFAFVTHLALFEVFVTLLPSESFLASSNILILGHDEAGMAKRSDTIMVVRVDPDNKEVRLISIPRDTRIPIPRYGEDKVNHAYAYGGALLSRQTIENWLQVPIPYYVVVDLKGLGHFVDQVGGVEVDIEKPMRYVDYSQKLFIDLHPGRQRLTGSQAVGYLRFRADAGGDISRISRQQNFVRAILTQISHAPPIQIPQMLMELTSYFETNMHTKQILGLAMVLRQAYELGHMQTQTLEGYPEVMNGVFYLRIPEERVLQARKILQGSR